MNYAKKLKRLNRLRNKFKIEFTTRKRQWLLNSLMHIIYKIDSELKEADRQIPRRYDEQIVRQIGDYNYDLQIKSNN